MWVMMALLSALFAGATAILSKMGVRDTDSTVATAIRTTLVLAFAWLLVFAQGLQAQLWQLSARTYLFLALSGLCTGASWLCYFHALKLGTVNQVTPVDKSSTVLTMLLAWLLLGEPITWLKAAAMVGIMAGTLLMIERRPETTPAAPRGHGWLLYAALSAVFAALTAILGKVGIENVPSDLGTALRTVVVLLMAWAMVFVTGRQAQVRAVGRRDLVFILPRPAGRPRQRGGAAGQTQRGGDHCVQPRVSARAPFAPRTGRICAAGGRHGAAAPVSILQIFSQSMTYPLQNIAHFW